MRLVSIDSRKAYKFLNIGTNKYSFVNKIKELHQQFKNSFQVCGLDLFEVHETINAFKFWERLVYQCNNIDNVSEAHYNNRKPVITIIFGGTLLYQKPILGLPLFDNPSGIPELRKILEQFPLETLQNIIQKMGITLNTSDFKNKRRLIRKIEIKLFTDMVNLQDINKDKVIKLLSDILRPSNVTKDIRLVTSREINSIAGALLSQYIEHRNIVTKANKLQSKITDIFGHNIAIVVFKPIKLLDQTYINKLFTRVSEMFKLGWHKEILELAKLDNSYSLPAFQIMGYDTLINLYANTLKGNTKLFNLITKVYSTLSSQQIKLLTKYYIQNHNLGLELIAQYLQEEIANGTDANNVSHEIQVLQQYLPLIYLPYLQIFKQHLNYARYQKNSVRSILKLPA